MSNDSLAERLPYNLRLSITNLWDMFGNTESILIGLLINLSLAATGVAIALLFDGVVAFLGGVWAILNVIGVVKWVFGL